MRRSALLLAFAAVCFAGEAAAEPRGDHGRWGDGGQYAQRSDRDGRGDKPGRGPDLGQRWSPDEARDGVQQGRLRPLSDIVRDLEGRYGGRLLSQELANDGARTVYRIRWMTADGRRLDLVIDAQGR